MSPDTRARLRKRLDNAADRLAWAIAWTVMHAAALNERRATRYSREMEE